MIERNKKPQIDKGRYLELRVARLLFAEGLTPFINVYFRREAEPVSVNSPDIDVMGCRFLSDTTSFFVHYDCKSGDSEVISRILMLMGLRHRIPSGPIVYVRKRTALDIKRYAIQQGIKVYNIAQLEERENELIKPLFGDLFPTISDLRVHEIWLGMKGRAKNQQLGRLLKYFDLEFWAEGPFTRLRRTIAAVSLIKRSAVEAGVNKDEQDVLIACAIRRFIFSLLSSASSVAFLSDTELSEAVKEWLITEKLPAHEYQAIVESAVQLSYEIYGDPRKGPLRSHDYYIPPPDYTEELVSLLKRTIRLYNTLPWVMPIFDAELFERNVLKRDQVADSLRRGINQEQFDAVNVWFKSVRLFLESREQSLSDWVGW